MQKEQNDYHDLDREAAKTWIYPINFPFRKYQYDIVKTALYDNTLVCLPTGLGKTFIGAVLMYNFYHWYPTGKIVFMAPTRPLVAQQIESCFNIMGIPQDHSMEMTGFMPPEKRNEAWAKINIFFLTPHVLVNDLARGVVPLKAIKLVVVDEAHKALGEHAYCQVIKLLQQQSYSFRILALSATPGSDLTAVQQVLSNLMISKIELRSEESPDVAKYIHNRTVETIVVQLDDELKALKEQYMQVLRKYVYRLLDKKVLFSRDETTLTKFQILKAREAFRQNPPVGLSRQVMGIMEGTFALCMSLYHGLELLNLHGARSFYKFLANTVENKTGVPNSAKGELAKDGQFKELFHCLRNKYGDADTTAINGMANISSNKEYAISHPKLRRLLEVVVDHFSKSAQNTSTRVMIFSQYRESVLEITEMLNKHQPVVKPMSFVGQSSGAKCDRHKFSQKQQMKVLSEFRSGGYNTLISTCVGEEGLDIGEVDLIICYDAQKSPIRIVQRMGRTGRKRDGKIIILVTEGKEHQDYKQCLYQRKSLNNHLSAGSRLNNHLYQNAPRMIPEGIEPVCVKLHMQVSEWKNKPSTKKSAKTLNSFFKDSNCNQSKSSETVPLLTAEQMTWYKENLEVSGRDVLSFQRPKLLSRTKVESSETERTIDLSDFQPWQTTLQGCVSILHSKRTQNFVDLSQFIGLQSFVEENEYEVNLKPYFNQDYFNAPEEQVVDNEALDRRKRKRTETKKTFGKKKVKKVVRLNKCKRDIGDIFAGIKKKQELNAAGLSDDNDIVFLDNTASVLGETEPPETSVWETSDFANLKLEDEVIFESAVVISDPVSFDDPPFFSADALPCSKIEIEDIFQKLTLQSEIQLRMQLSAIFAPEPATKCIPLFDLFSPCSKVVSNAKCENSQDTNGVHCTLDCSIADKVKSPILLSSYRERYPPKMTSTPKQSNIKHPKIATSSILKSNANLCGRYSKNEYNIKQSANFDLFGSESITQQNKDFVRFDLLDEEINSTNERPSELNIVNSSNHKDSVNFDLLDADLFLDVDLTFVERQAQNQLQTDIVEPIEVVAPSNFKKRSKPQSNTEYESNSVQKLNKSNRIFNSSNQYEFVKGFASPKLITTSMRNDGKEILNSTLKDPSFMSVTQVIDMVNDSATVVKFPPKGGDFLARKTNHVNKSDDFLLSSKIKCQQAPILHQQLDDSKFSNGSLSDKIFGTLNQTNNAGNACKGWFSCNKNDLRHKKNQGLKGGLSFKENLPVEDYRKSKNTPVFTTKTVKTDQIKSKNLFQSNSDDNFEDIFEGVNLSLVEENLLDPAFLKTAHEDTPRNASFEKCRSQAESLQSWDFNVHVKNEIYHKRDRKFVDENSYINSQANCDRMSANTRIPDVKNPEVIIIDGDNDENEVVTESDHFRRTVLPIYNSSVKHSKAHLLDEVKSPNEMAYSVAKDHLISPKLPSRKLLLSQATCNKNLKNVSFRLNSQAVCLKKSTLRNSGDLCDTYSLNEMDFDSEGDFESQLRANSKKIADTKIPTQLADDLYTSSENSPRAIINSGATSLSSPSNIIQPSHLSGDKYANRSHGNEGFDFQLSKSFNDSKSDSILVQKRKQPCNIIGSDSDTDFETQLMKSVKRGRDDDDDSDDCPVPKKKKKRQVNAAVKFIDWEAGVSDGTNSSDDSESNLDSYDQSFIDDQSRLTQAAADMKAVYLRSVRSPIKKSITVGGKAGVFQSNQRPQNVSFDEDFEDDEEDSFVVDNDFIEYETQFMGTSMLAEDPIINQAIADKCKVKENKKHKRIIKYISSEEENSPIRPTNLNDRYSAKTPLARDLPSPKIVSANINSSKFLQSKQLVTRNALTVKHIRKDDDFSSEELFQPLNRRLTGKSNKISTFGKESSESVKEWTQSKDENELAVDFTKKKSRLSSPTNSSVNLNDSIIYNSQSTGNEGVGISGKQCIMVDSAEVNIAGVITSRLRLKCGVQTCIRKIHPASYVISSRIGVYKLHYSAFSKSCNRISIVERVQSLLMLYERPTLIVEKDNNLDVVNIQRNCYIDTISCALMQLPQLKLLYSNNSEETGDMLEHLIKIEKMKGYSLPYLNFHDKSIENTLKFYSCIPKLSPASAVILVSKYSKISHLISCISTTFVKDCGISKEQRNLVVAHFQRHFNKDLLPASYRFI